MDAAMCGATMTFGTRGVGTNNGFIIITLPQAMKSIRLRCSSSFGAAIRIASRNHASAYSRRSVRGLPGELRCDVAQYVLTNWVRAPPPLAVFAKAFCSGRMARVRR